MALHRQTFQTRTLTAIVFAAVMLMGLLWNRWSFFILFSVIHFGCWIEYQKLVTKINCNYAAIIPFHKYGIMIAGWCLLLYFTNDELQVLGIRLTEVGLWLGLISALALPLIILLKSKKFFLENIGYSAFGLLYISLSLALFVDLRNHWIEEKYRLNMVIPLLIIFTLWINDTMAYIVGSFIGKTPMSSISPKKTWEGTIGGVILAIVIMCVIAFYTRKFSVVHTAVIAIITTVAGTFGDLFESKLKRLASVKDSGNIMPGHGGFLDRFDSLLFASVAVWFYAVFVIGE
ncbi:MAG: phosphatidate cytidylyltransferase [Chitinophagaceae bacterium]|nr:phosphatidate cytidylyltransferase [Chitinophagaceae bacterium]